jgi:photosystem II oxygen-evolving enhancer protein 1
MSMSLKDDLAAIGTAAVVGALAFGLTAEPAAALTKAEINQLSYLQVKGTGLANRCPEVIGEDSITPKSGSRLVDMCIEPKAWAVEEEVGKAGKTEKKFVNSKVMTRQTYTLDGIEGRLDMSGGNIVFKEEEGIDYAPTTVQLPGGERVPFLFTVKELVAKGSGSAFKPGFQMGGDFSTPSYRTGLFLDPKGRGGTTGYDWLSPFRVCNLERKVMKSFSRKTTRRSMSPLDVLKWKSTRSTLLNKKLEESLLPPNWVIPIWVPRSPRRSSPRVSSTPVFSK